MNKQTYQEKIEKLIEKCSNHAMYLKNLNEKYSVMREDFAELNKEYYSNDTKKDESGEEYSIETIFGEDQIYEIITEFENQKIALLKNIAASLDE